MFKKFKWSGFTVLVLIMSLLLSACSDNGSNETGGKDKDGVNDKGNGTTEDSADSNLAKKQVLNLYAGNDFSSLDVAHAQDAPAFEGLYKIRSGLMTLNSKSEVVPDMAAEMPKVSDDKKVYTFKIRDDAQWSNGDPVTAQDFVYSWRRVVKPDTGAEYAFIFPEARIKNAEKIMDENSDLYGQVKKLGIEAVDSKTLKVTLEKPTPFFISLMSFPTFFPLNEKFVEKQGEKFATSPEKMLSNGPFKLVQWTHGEGWQYQKNEDYWNADKIKLEKVNYKVVKEISTRINLYQTDKLDFTKVNTQFITQFQDSDELHKKLTSNITFIRLNEKNEALANEDIRDAIYNAFDRKELTDTLIKDGSTPARYLVPKNFVKGPNGKDFRSGNAKINEMSLEEAKASWEKGLKEIGKDSVTIRLMFSESDLLQNITTFMKGQLEKNLPGLTVKLQKVSYNQHLKLESSRKYDMSYWGWNPDYRDPMTYLDLWMSGKSFNATGYANSEFDKLIEKAKNSGEKPEKRWKLMQKAEKTVLEDAAVVPTYQGGISYLQKPYVKNLSIKSYGPNVDWKYAYIVEH